MTVFFRIFSIVVVTFLLIDSSVAYESSAPDSAQDSITNHHESTPDRHVANSGMLWQILPGENIHQIASMMFPDQPTVHDNFIRAVIRTNPELFPNGVYQPLPTGTTIFIPDLRTINTYSRSPSKAQKPDKADNIVDNQLPETSEDSSPSNLASNQSEWQWLIRLQQLAENELHELSILIKRIESLELRFDDIYPRLLALIQALHEPVTDYSLPSQPDSQQPDNPILPDANNIILAENQPTFDTVFVIGILLTALIVLTMLWSYRKIKERSLRSTDNTLFPEVADSHPFDDFAAHQENSSTEPSDHLANEYDQLAVTARSIAQQHGPEAAIQFLQKQLSVYRLDIPGWILLFELLFNSGSKTDFKKNARRFKRLGGFPDIWAQIQILGNRLEPDEPLYFDEQKRKDKFFPDLSNSR
ncbi:MAG: hypothetical protein KA343_00920 [Nitrosomonas sp.]|nr:hypothetical protein [Nitrosomonas sp.]